MIAEQWRQASPDTKIDPHPRILRVSAIHIIALLISNHFQRQLVMVAQEKCPLTAGVDLGSLRPDVDKWETVLHSHSHEHPRHQREMEGHVTFLAFSQVGN